MQLSELWKSYSDLTIHVNKGAADHEVRFLVKELDNLAQQIIDTKSISLNDVVMKLNLLREEIENELKGNHLVEELMTSIEKDIANLIRLFEERTSGEPPGETTSGQRLA